MWLVADFGRGAAVAWTQLLDLAHLGALVVASDYVHPQCISRLAGFDAVGALVEEALDVRLYVLLHRRPHLAGEVALGALPAGLARHGVVAGDHELVDLPVQLHVHRCLRVPHLASLSPLSWLHLLTVALLIRYLQINQSIFMLISKRVEKKTETKQN